MTKPRGVGKIMWRFGTVQEKKIAYEHRWRNEMLIINDKYAIKNDGLCYAICKARKQKGEIKFIARWYFNTLSQAICFLTDRAIDIPSDLKTLSDGIESFKNDVLNATLGV